MEKIIVIGYPGAGKSTFAKKLSKIINLPLYHLDLLWHKPDKTTLSKEQFNAELCKIFQEHAWILDGNYQRTLEMRLQECDTVFLLDFPVEECLAGAKSRVGTKREDLPWAEETLNPEFEQRILEFPKTKLPKIYEMLEKQQGQKEIHIFRTRSEIDEYIAQLERKDKNGMDD